MRQFIIPFIILYSLSINVSFAKTEAPIAPSPAVDEKTLTELAHSGQAEAQFNLAMFYQSHGQLDKAAYWYKLSASQQFTKAQINLALMYQQGVGIGKNEKEMLRWMEAAAKAGDPIGQMNMAEYTLQGIPNVLVKNSQQALIWLEAAAAQQFPAAQLTLAYWYEQGTAGNKDPQKSHAIYLALAEKNHPQALYILGYQAATGMYEKINYPLAFQYFTRSAELGFSPAQNSLGMLYLAGQGTKRDTVSAIKWLTLAAEQGEVSAQFNLALIYARGDGITANQAKACQWFIKAANQNSRDAQYASGACYQYGMGVPQNDNKALSWYRLAAKQGDERAQKKVIIMENELQNSGKEK